MSTRVLTTTRHNINTAHINKLLTNPLYVQILDVLGREELTFSELADMLRRDEEQLSYDLNMLVKAGAVRRYSNHNQITYALADNRFRQTISILYELWAERIRATESRHPRYVVRL